MLEKGMPDGGMLEEVIVGNGLATGLDKDCNIVLASIRVDFCLGYLFQSDSPAYMRISIYY